MNDIVGILPAAGMASRLRPLRYPKELLPIVFALDRSSGRARPVVAAEYSLTAMREAGIEKCIVIVNENKTEILKYFGSGAELGMKLVYAVQSKPTGLPQAIRAAQEWLGADYVCLTLPDTVFRPRRAVGQICEELRSSSGDLVLGVFPTAEPQNLGPVRVAADGRVVEVQDKPPATDLLNTWGMAVWKPRFTALLDQTVARWEAEQGPATERPLGEIFNDAIHAGLNVRAVCFEDGAFLDVGKPEGLSAIVLEGPEW